jgi:hypothetical protein
MSCGCLSSELQEFELYLTCSMHEGCSVGYRFSMYLTHIPCRNDLRHLPSTLHVCRYRPGDDIVVQGEQGLVEGFCHGGLQR